MYFTCSHIKQQLQIHEREYLAKTTLYYNCCVFCLVAPARCLEDMCWASKTKSALNAGRWRPRCVHYQRKCEMLLSSLVLFVSTSDPRPYHCPAHTGARERDGSRPTSCGTKAQVNKKRLVPLFFIFFLGTGTTPSLARNRSDDGKPKNSKKKLSNP